MRSGKIVLALAAVALALPASASAATSSSTSDVTATASAELSLSAAVPATMALTHSVPATTTSVITVTSTSASWTLSLHDASLTTPGQMDKVDCSTRIAATGSLANALQWAPDGTTFSNLSGTPATVGTGALVDAETVTYKQALQSNEDVAANQCYQLTATYTVTDA